METMERNKEVSMNFIERVNKIFNDRFLNNGSSYLLDLRKRNLDKFNKIGLPTLKHEEWKYTNLAFLNDLDFNLLPFISSTEAVNALKNINFLNETECIVIPILNGVVEKHLGNFEDLITIAKFQEKIDEDGSNRLNLFNHFFEDSNPFSYLNLALFNDGVYLNVKPNVELEFPIVLFYYYDSEYTGLSNTLNLIEIPENVKADIIVLFVNNSQEKVIANEMTNLHISKHANVELNFVQIDLKNMFLINNLNVISESESNFKTNVFSFNTNFVRNNINYDFNGEHSTTFLNGIYFVDDGNFVDNHTLVMHSKPHCMSDENFKGILDGNGRAVFNGKIYVARNAQKTNAYQSNKNLLLSNSARINTKPQLEIYADDVKCTHGATAGFLDQDMLFYIISRGISKEKAKSLLLNSFVSENLEKVGSNELRNYLKELVARKLHLEDIFFCSSIEELTKVSL